MGLISLPAMLRNKYSAPLATGTIAASGTLGQIIPPSIVLIILADQLATASDQAGTMRKALYKEATGQISMPSIFDVTSTSAGEMFLGAFLPGILLVGIYMLFILVLAFVSPKSAPSVPYKVKWIKILAKCNVDFNTSININYISLGFNYYWNCNSKSGRSYRRCWCYNYGGL